nr:hypothetical protein [Tanacetum cinerariifolium]
MFLTHSDEALEIEKFKRSRENKIEFSYDYGNLNASYVNEKIIFEDDYSQEIINPDFEKIDSLFQQTSSLKPYVSNVILEKIIIDLEDEVVNILEKEKVNLETIESLKSKGFESSEKVCSESENQIENDCLVVEKECDKKENSKVIAPGMFKLNMSQCVSPISMSKSSCDSNNVEIKLKRKRRKQKSSKQNVKHVDNDVSRANSDFVHFSNLDTFSSVRRPKHSSVVWKNKGSSNTSNNLDVDTNSIPKKLRCVLVLKWGLKRMGLGDEMGGFGAEMVTLGAPMVVGLEAKIGGFRRVNLGVEIGAEVGAFAVEMGLKRVRLGTEIGGFGAEMGDVGLKLRIRGLPVRSWSRQMDVGRVINDISFGIISMWFSVKKGKSLCYNSWYEFQDDVWFHQVVCRCTFRTRTQLFHASKEDLPKGAALRRSTRQK